MKSFIAALVVGLTVAAATIDTTPVAAQGGDGGFAGVWAVRRVATESTCQGVGRGDVASSLWVIGWRRAAGFALDVLGPSSFTTLNGRIQEA